MGFQSMPCAAWLNAGWGRAPAERRRVAVVANTVPPGRRSPPFAQDSPSSSVTSWPNRIPVRRRRASVHASVRRSCARPPAIQIQCPA